MESADDIISNARAARDRIVGGDADFAAFAQRRQSRRANRMGRRVARIAVADAAILMAAFVVGLFWPLGVLGAFVVLLALIGVTAYLGLYNDAPTPTFEKVRQAPVRILPQQTSRWLDAERANLPRTAAELINRILLRLDALGPQLAGLDDDAPAAGEVRKLVGEQLPDFIRDYERVPPTLRKIERNGQTPDAQLVDGLKVIEQEIAEMTQRLAEGDLDSLATRGRYLRIKYQGDTVEG